MTDRFLEIGPGHGALTFSLASAGAQVIAVEIDRDLATELNQNKPSTVEVVAADFLSLAVPDLLTSSWTKSISQSTSIRVVGTLPYNISSPILSKLLTVQRDTELFTDATFVFQREVADRLVSTPGSRNYGPLAIATQLYADVSSLMHFPPRAFHPSPKVYSTAVRLSFRSPLVKMTDPCLFEMMVRSLFTQRRKTLNNALKPFADSISRSAPEVLESANLDPTRRPETLELPELARLAETFVSTNP